MIYNFDSKILSGLEFSIWEKRHNLFFPFIVLKVIAFGYVCIFKVSYTCLNTDIIFKRWNFTDN